MNDEVKRKYERLKHILCDMDSVLVAFSGGVDSSALLAAAHDALGKNVLAVSALSPTYKACEFETAKRIAAQLEVEHAAVQTCEMGDENFRSNPHDRCYYCKSKLFSTLIDLAKERKLNHVIEGSNADDLEDYRPGMKAIRELNIRSPFIDAGITKSDVRQIARSFNLPVWNKPAQACLSSRIPYGSEITTERLKRIEDAEAFIAGLGFDVVRVRDFETKARVEVGQDETDRLLDKKIVVEQELLRLGYDDVEIDELGYRMGSLNRALGGHDINQ